MLFFVKSSRKGCCIEINGMVLVAQCHGDCGVMDWRKQRKHLNSFRLVQDLNNV